MNTTFVVIRKVGKVLVMAGLLFGSAAFGQTKEVKKDLENSARVEVPKGFESADFSPFGDKIRTKESLVSIDGQIYRKVEYQKDIFYLKLLRLNDGNSSEVICDYLQKEKGVHLVEGSMQIARRTAVFIEGLKQVCTGSHGSKMIVVTPDLRMGFTIKDQPKDTLTNKKVFVVPGLGGALFQGDW